MFIYSVIKIIFWINLPEQNDFHFIFMYVTEFLDEAEPGHGQEAVGLAHVGHHQEVPASTQAPLPTQVNTIKDYLEVLVDMACGHGPPLNLYALSAVSTDSSSVIGLLALLSFLFHNIFYSRDEHSRLFRDFALTNNIKARKLKRKSRIRNIRR